MHALRLIFIIARSREIAHLTKLSLITRLVSLAWMKAAKQVEKESLHPVIIGV